MKSQTFMQQLEQRTKPLQSTVIEKEFETLERIKFNSVEWFKQIKILKKKYGETNTLTIISNKLIISCKCGCKVFHHNGRCKECKRKL